MVWATRLATFQRNRPEAVTASGLESPMYMGFFAGEPHRTRTYNQLIKSQLLCQLS
jgi:hypothetical protein